MTTRPQLAILDRGSRMRADTFLRIVTADHTDLLGHVVRTFRKADIRFCVVGGQAVNAYVEPLVSLDLDLVVAAGRIDDAVSILGSDVRVEHFPHSLNLAMTGSDLRVQIQTDVRYLPFVMRATDREVLGQILPVAALEDVLQGKIWAADDSTRRPSERQKDLADIARIIEAYPHLREHVPPQLLNRLV